jgi:hypothetical protein
MDGSVPMPVHDYRASRFQLSSGGAFPGIDYFAISRAGDPRRFRTGFYLRNAKSRVAFVTVDFPAEFGEKSSFPWFCTKNGRQTT